MTMKSAIRDILWTLLFAIVAFLVLRASVQTVRVDLPSMEPTIQPGWWIMLNKVSYHFTDPKRGDIVVFDSPINPAQDLIKRVIGLPGDTVEVKNNTVFVNGVPLQEPYVAIPPHYTMAPETIPAGQYFVLGDNRDVSIDSHYGWLVPRDKLVGRAWIVIWPPSKWGKAPNYSYLADTAALSSSQGVAALTTR